MRRRGGLNDGFIHLIAKKTNARSDKKSGQQEEQEDVYIPDESDEPSESWGSGVTEDESDAGDCIRDLVNEMLDFVTIYPDMSNESRCLYTFAIITSNQTVVHLEAVFQEYLHVGYHHI